MTADKVGDNHTAHLERATAPELEVKAGGGNGGDDESANRASLAAAMVGVGPVLFYQPVFR